MPSIQCPYCGSNHVRLNGVRRGTQVVSQRYECQNPSCERSWSEHIDEEEPQENDTVSSLSSNSYEEGRDFINIICSSPRILSEQEIIEQFKVDTEKWEIQSFQVKTTEGYRKDRTVDWHVQNGKVTSGNVDDSGKMLVVPLFHIKATFRRKVTEVRFKLLLDDFMEDAKKHAPHYEKIHYPKITDGLMYEVTFPDLHFGRLTWGQETGDDYDIKIARDLLKRVVDELLGYVQQYPIAKILLPLGNDFFNVDNKNESTSHDTPQQEDTRWKKTYKKGRELLVDVIDRCSQIAPVDVLIIPGNHDEQRMFYVGDSLECWYHRSEDVTVNNSPKNRKYYLFGTNLIGFAHGYWEKLGKLTSVMPMEAPDLWAKSKIREFHTGDKHNKQDLVHVTDESTGMVIRVLRSLAGKDAWTYDNTYIGAQRAAEAFLWHPTKGLIAQFSAYPPDAKPE